MRSSFEATLIRFLRGGTRPTPLEACLIARLVESLPPDIRSPLAAQLDAYNLVQREVDGRALNFYRRRRGRVDRRDLPVLPVKDGEVPLLKMTFSIPGRTGKYHATMAAIDRYFFCLNFSHDLRPYARDQEVVVSDITHSWRSNYEPQAAIDHNAH